MASWPASYVLGLEDQVLGLEGLVLGLFLCVECSSLALALNFVALTASLVVACLFSTSLPLAIEKHDDIRIW